jgi:hypothetical protein
MRCQAIGELVALLCSTGIVGSMIATVLGHF